MTRVPLPDSFLRLPITHRALHDRAAGRIENSPSAIRAAVEAGYGIEIDLQLASDGVPMVFHDETLDRLHRAGMGIEINAHYPQLQDDVTLLRGAAARGMVVAFSLDLHYPEEFGNWRYFEDVVELSGVDYGALNLYDPSRRRQMKTRG